MLRQAQQKIADLALTNIEFEEADADEQQFQESQFDAILCSSAIVYLTDIPKALRQWHNALKMDRAGKAVVKTKRAIDYINCLIGVASIATAI